ncbi:hypothetical protein [Chitinophaga costaii]|nr:hypothetical protein [Chitinophaga costaii]
MQKVIKQVGRKYLTIALLAGIAQFFLFKKLYPFPDFISDSYSYIATNLYHMQVNLWPVGYSLFLNLIHHITPSHYFLVFCQFLILQGAFLYFFYTVLYLYALHRTNKILLFLFLFFNPAFFYLSNCVLSDAIFCALSIVLFSQYLWMYHKPTRRNLIIQAVIIGLAFTIRYTAIYYPIVSIGAMLLSGYRLPLKLIGMALPWFFILPFIKYTEQKTKELTGTAEFSVFGGWQLANNALYMYGHIVVDSARLPANLRDLDKAAKEYFSSTPPTEDDLTAIQGTYFIKKRDAILKPYMQSHSQFTGSAVSQFQAWGAVSPTYNQYGRYLITHYPVEFARYYLWLNTKNYFVPYLEKYSNYNLGQPTMADIAAEWFALDSPNVCKVPHTASQVWVFIFYPIVFMILNIYFTICLVDVLISGRLKQWRSFSITTLLLAAFFLLVNFGFSVFATPVVMRYQLVPMTILFFFSLYMTQFISNKPISASSQPAMRPVHPPLQQ